jgi:hypothetical protein
VLDGIDVTSPTPTGESQNAHEDDFVAKHGKRITVIIFSILAGDTLPAIINDGMDPRKKFYTIVALTLPYTVSLVVAFIILGAGIAATADGSAAPLSVAAIMAVLFMVLFAWLCSRLHLGISDIEYDDLMRKAHELNRGMSWRIQLFNTTDVFIKFFFHKYGVALFVGATLAAIVIAWNIVNWDSATPKSQPGIGQ